MLRKIIFLILSMCILTVFVSVKNSNAQSISEQDRDGYILYSYSLKDAESGTNETIKTVTKNNILKYIFKNHTLSCGTVMNGDIKKFTVNNKTKITGRFSVSKNNYGIKKLRIDIVLDKSKNTKSGTLYINNKKIDINLF